jgi:putative addiction module component (TIGR02574 family)
MSTVIENLLTQALQMPSKDRALIAERLITSLDTEADWDVEVAWQQEVQKRIEQIEKGEVICIPWEQVLNRLRGNGRAAA